MSNNPPNDLVPDLNHGPVIVAIGWAGFAISAAFVAARLFTRVYLSNMTGWDDGLLIFSVVLNLVGLIMISISVSYGLGRHAMYLSDEDQSHVLFYAGICQPFIVASSLIPKQAVAILIIRLMGPQKHGKWFFYGLFIILYTETASCLMFLWLRCDPPSSYWRLDIKRNCLSALILERLTIFAGAWSAFVSLCLATFPITILWDLKIEKRKKVMVLILMGLGIIAMICGIVKTYYLPLAAKEDFSWAFFHLLVWTFTETDVVIICACLPVLPRLFIFIKRRRTSRTDVAGAAKAPVMTNVIQSLPEAHKSWGTGLRSGNYVSAICSNTSDFQNTNRSLPKNVIFKSVDFEQQIEYG